MQAKHAAPLAAVAARAGGARLLARGLADGLVVSGAATGEATAIGDLKRVRGAVPDVPLLVGCGATPETAAELLVGGRRRSSSAPRVKRDGVVGNPVDVERVRRLVAAVRGARWLSRRGAARLSPVLSRSSWLAPASPPACSGALRDGRRRAGDRPWRWGISLLVGFRGTEVEGNEELRALICDVKVGGLILFERDTATRAPRNIVDAEQLARLTADPQALARRCAGRPLLIAADAEGGRVMRLSPRAGYAATLSAQELGDSDDVAQTELDARRMGGTLREAGINWNLAPVVDVAVNPANPRGGRAGPHVLARIRAEVTAHARAFVRGMHAAGACSPALKHFPGHGIEPPDSHLGFTDVTDTADLDVELVALSSPDRGGARRQRHDRARLQPRLDPWDPATLSRYTVHRILRDRFKYKAWWSPTTS